MEETRLRSVLEDKGTGWLRRCGGPPDEALSLAIPTLLQHKLLVHLMAPEVQAGPWQRVLRYERGALGTLGQPTLLGLSVATSGDQQRHTPQMLRKGPEEGSTVSCSHTNFF